MKLLKPLFLMLLLAIVFIGRSQTLVINGSVTNLVSGTPVGEQKIYFIRSGSIDTITTQTNALGEFSKSIECMGDSGAIQVFTVDPCSGNTHNAIAGVWNAADFIRFYVCDSAKVNKCSASFYSSNDFLTAYFFDQSVGNINNWSWDFGDGQTSTVQNPVHKYTESGRYFVKLNILGVDCECNYSTNVFVYEDITDSTEIIVPQECQANFVFYPDTSKNQNPDDKLSILFIDQSKGNINRWEWNFGDGQISTLQYPQHTYSAAGNYLVTLNIYGDDCESNYSVQIVAGSTTTTIEQQECQSNFIFYPDTLIAQNPGFLTIRFVDQSKGNINRWEWNFGDGQTSAEQSPLHAFAEAGTYSVTLNIFGDSCESSYSIELKPTVIYEDVLKATLSIPAKELNKIQMKVYPNPVDSKANICFYSKVNETVRITVSDLTGKVYLSNAISATQGKNNLEIETTTLEKGSYILQVVQSKAKESINFIKE